MIKSWVVDLRHFLLPDGKVAPLPPRAQRLFAFWSEIVSQATQYDDPTRLIRRRLPEQSNESSGVQSVRWTAPFLGDFELP